MITEEPVNALEQWLRSNNAVYVHPQLRFASDETNGVHWRATNHIDARQKLMSIPHSFCLSYLNALVDDAYPVFKMKRASFTVEAIGFFYLMLQQIYRETSFWKPYLVTLPSSDSLSTPLWFDEEDSLWLHGTDVAETMAKRKLSYQEYYESGTALLQDSGVDTSKFTWSVSIQMLEAVVDTRELFCWAITIFTSRSFHSSSLAPQDSKYWAAYKTSTNGSRQAVLLDLSHVPSSDRSFSVLYPGIDVGNHDLSAEALWTFEPGEFSIAVQQSVLAGQQIYNNYGPKPNHEFLQGYGFTLEHNPNDVILLTLKAPPETLQVEMRSTHPGFFDSTGRWQPEKATFGLKHAKPDVANALAVFSQLPDPLVDLLTLVLRDKHGLQFDPLENGQVELDSVEWQRYMPHIARILQQSLLSKYAALSQADLGSPRNLKQHYAKYYRDGQICILKSYLSGLTEYLHHISTVQNSSATRLAKLNSVLASMDRVAPGAAEAFMQGIEANAQSSDLDTLRAAGWEDDIWILVLCYYSLITAADPFHAWLQDMAREYETQSKDATDDRPPREQIDSLVDLVQVAAEAVPGTAWSDSGFNANLLAFGARIFANESFTLAYAGSTEPELCICWFRTT